MKKISVLLADDHSVVRQGLQVLLGRDPGIEVVGHAENGKHAVALATRLQPAVIVMDVAMPILNGIQATHLICKRLPNTQVLVLSSFSDDETLRRMILAGAAGYLTKQNATTDLVPAIYEIFRGNSWFSPGVAKRLAQLLTQHPKPGEFRQAAQLTDRENEVLQLIAEGFANKQIAEELSISINTVEKHRQRLMAKLGLHERAGLTRYALEHGIIEGEHHEDS
jgi:DNA-binding NarL/FixJ family response regulator